MNIKEFSKSTGLSAHTLRYYEKIGLMRNIYRNASGHRDYSQKDLDWVVFILRLKETNMALSDILKYGRLREQGHITLSERQKMLEKHRLQLKERIDQQQIHLKALDQKISLYQAGKVS